MVSNRFSSQVLDFLAGFFPGLVDAAEFGKIGARHP